MPFASVLYLWDVVFDAISSFWFWFRILLVVALLSGWVYRNHKRETNRSVLQCRIAGKVSLVIELNRASAIRRVREEKNAEARRFWRKLVAIAVSRRRALDKLPTVEESRERLARATLLREQRREAHRTQRRQLKTQRDQTIQAHQEAQNKRLKDQSDLLESIRRTHEQDLVALDRLSEARFSGLKRNSDLLVSNLASANEAHEAIASSYRAQVAHSKQEVLTHKTKYATLKTTLQSTRLAHQTHLEKYEQDRRSANARNEELEAHLKARDAVINELKSKHATVSSAYTQLEARFEEKQHELQLEKQRRPTLSVTTTASVPQEDPRLSSAETPREAPAEQPTTDACTEASTPCPAVSTSHSSPPSDSFEASGRYTAFTSKVASTSTPWASRPRRIFQSTLAAHPQKIERNPIEPVDHSLAGTSHIVESEPLSPAEETVIDEDDRYRAFTIKVAKTSTPKDARRKPHFGCGPAKQQASDRVDTVSRPVADATLVNTTERPSNRLSLLSKLASKIHSPPEVECIDSRHPRPTFGFAPTATSTPWTARPKLFTRVAQTQKKTEAHAEPDAEPLLPMNSCPLTHQHYREQGNRYRTFTLGVQGSSTPRSARQERPQQPSQRRAVEHQAKHAAFAKGVGAASTPLSHRQVLKPQIGNGPQEHIEEPMVESHSQVSHLEDNSLHHPRQEQPTSVTSPSSPLSNPAPSVHDSSPSSPPGLGNKLKGKEKLGPSASESFFAPNPVEWASHQNPEQFVPKSTIAPLPEYVEDSSINGLPQGKTPFPVRARRPLRFVPDYPETPSREPLGKGRYSNLLGRLSALGTAKREDL